MKLSLLIVSLVFSIFAFPDWARTQNMGTKTKSRSKSVAKNSQAILLKRKQDKLHAKKLVQQFIDGVFVKRNTKQTFEDLTAFEYWDEVDEEEFGHGSLLKKMPLDLGHSVNSRIAAAVFRYEYQRYFLDLGIYPITKSELAYPFSAPDYKSLKSSAPDFDSLRSEALKKNTSLQIDFDFKNSSKQEIEQRLTDVESYLDNIENLIFEQINIDTYSKNIKIMKRTIVVKRKFEKKRTYYAISLKSPDLGFILRIKDDDMKIIGLFDGV